MDVGLAVVVLLNALMQGVLCNKWAVTMPQKILGVDGSCVTIPCRFQIPDQEEANLQNCSDGGAWKKGDIGGPQIFAARNPRNNDFQGKIIGDLTERNCTTVFNNFPKDFNETLIFRLDCQNTIKYSFSNGVNISVQPGLTPSLLREVRQVSEGDQVRLQCSVPAPCPSLPPSIAWLPPSDAGQEHTHTQQSADGQITVTSTLKFTASADHHRQRFVCSVSFPLTKGGSSRPSAATQTLDVLYAPRSTVSNISKSGPVSEGRVVTLTCSSDANPPVSRYTWYQSDGNKLTQRGEGEELVLVVRQGDSGVYMCEAQSLRGAQRSRPVTLEVDAAPVVNNSVVGVPFIICGVLLVLYLLTLAVEVYKYRSISTRLQAIELKSEHTYTDLRISNVTSDYEQIQPKTTPSRGASNYENLQQLPFKLISDINKRQQGRNGAAASFP